MPWQATVLRRGEDRFILKGCGLVYHGDIFQGRMDRDLYWGLKALENPALRQKIQQPHRLYVPQSHLQRPNTGDDRRVVHLVPEQYGAPIVLKFAEKVESELLRDLRAAFSKEQAHAQVHSGSLDGPPDPALADRQGDGDADDRQSAQGRQRARLRQGQEVARPVRKKTPKPKARKTR